MEILEFIFKWYFILLGLAVVVMLIDISFGFIGVWSNGIAKRQAMRGIAKKIEREQHSLRHVYYAGAMTGRGRGRKAPSKSSSLDEANTHVGRWR